MKMKTKAKRKPPLESQQMIRRGRFQEYERVRTSNFDVNDPEITTNIRSGILISLETELSEPEFALKNINSFWREMYVSS